MTSNFTFRFITSFLDKKERTTTIDFGVLKIKLLLIGILFSSFAFKSNAQQISINSPIATEVEGNGVVVAFEIFIEGGGSSAVDITGTISYAGSAIGGSDYIPVPSFIIPAGANSTTIIVSLVNDAIVEPTETLIAILTGNPSSGVYANTNATVTILDDDAGSLFISIGSPTDGVEGSTFVTFLVFLEGGLVNNTGAAISGTINYVGTANNPADFTGPPTFTIPAGANSTLVIVTVIDDFLTEPTESVIAILTGSPSIGTYANTTSTAFIIDDDASTLTMSIGSPIDGAEGGGDVNFVVSIDAGAVNGTGAPIFGTINFLGNATSGVDYSSAGGIFSIADGESTDTILLVVLDDLCIEFTESVVATISSPSIGSISLNDTSTAYIQDNDLGLASISIGTPVDGAEPASDVSFVISIDNGLTNCTGAPITGALSTLGSATPGVDYVSVTSFSIPDGASFAQLVLSVIDDLIIEPTETIIATISNPSIGVISSSNMSTANIVDNDSTNGFDDIYLNNLNVKIYPNPVNSTLNLDAEIQMKNYSIADLNGRVMTSGILTTKQATLNVDTLPKGFYFVTVVFDDGSTAIKKVLKQ